MPIFDYRCEACGTVVEILILPHEKSEPTCPKCGSAMKRIFSGSLGLVFKGSGFYITDYKNKETNSKSKIKDSKGNNGGKNSS